MRRRWGSEIRMRHAACPTTPSKSGFLPRKMLLVPAHRSLDPVDNMARLANAVAFAWVADEDCLHAHVLQRNVELLGLRKWHIVIVFAVDQHCRRGDFGNVI